jgi:branched-chain amino acid transport system permease protein
MTEITQRPWFRPVIGVAIVIVLAALPLLAIPGFGILPGPTYSPGSLQVLAICCLIAALALSYHLLFGVAGLLSFGHALYFGVGVYGLGIVLDRTELPLLAAAALVLVGGIVIAQVLGAISLRVSGISFAMVTLAFAQAGNVIVRRNPGQTTGGEEGLALNTSGVPEALVGVVNTRNLYWLALAVVVVVFLVVTWIERSRAGHLIAATRENEMRVRVLGGSPYVVKLLTFTISATLATVVGMVYLLLQSGAQPRATSADFTLTLLVMVVLGGVGSRIGAVIGGVLYTLLDQRLGALASSPAIENLPAFLHVPLSEPLFLLGTLFILVVLFMPGGISGAIDRFTPRGRAKPDPRQTLEEVV